MLNYWALKRRAEETEDAVFGIAPMTISGAPGISWTLVSMDLEGEPITTDVIRESTESRRLMAKVALVACARARQNVTERMR